MSSDVELDKSAAYDAARRLEDSGLLTARQADVFALRELANVGRDETADKLRISTSAVDNHLSAARTHVQAARRAVDVLDDLGPDPREELHGRRPTDWPDRLRATCPGCDERADHELVVEPVTASTGAWGKYVRGGYVCDECGHEGLLLRTHESDEHVDAAGFLGRPEYVDE